MPIKCVYYDLETTGLNFPHHIGIEIIEIAALSCKYLHILLFYCQLSNHIIQNLQ